MAHHPGDPVASQEQRDPPALLAGHLGIHEEILQFLLPRHAQGPEAIAGTPAPERQRPLQQSRAQHRSPGVPMTGRDVVCGDPPHPDPAREGSPGRPDPASERDVTRGFRRRDPAARPAIRSRIGGWPDPDLGALPPSLEPAREPHDGVPCEQAPERCEVPPRQGVPAPARPLEQRLECAARHGRRGRAQGRHAQPHCGPRLPPRLPHEQGGLGREGCVVLAQQGRQRGQRLEDPGVVLFRQQGEQAVPDAVPAVGVRGVRGVRAKGHMLGGRVGLHPGPRELEERPDDAIADRGDAAEAPGSRPPQKVQQDGLRMIVPGVGHGDTGGPHPLCNRVQAAVAGRPRPGLDRLPATPVRGVQAGHRGPQAQPGRLGHDEGRIPVGRLAAQAVVHVSHVQPEAEAGLEPRQHREEDHGIHPAGDGHHQALFGRHPGVPEGARDTIHQTHPRHPELPIPALSFTSRWRFVMLPCTPAQPLPRLAAELSEATGRRQRKSRASASGPPQILLESTASPLLWSARYGSGEPGTARDGPHRRRRAVHS
ncbi:MAG: hypothetical protein A3H39_16240 [candidate division NC10 bacterium RIFCSPLOWO2_02_FULL_66_22]|nr:MAG: hypothetical protein A3H39_16240 [candidate division NC10 bacterium RIFCSPLOWO2_02_FULL_66_22]